MSIPLIQETTKDAINTSIIAIKRNIERINMLLGLVDSGSPDLSGLATKQELEDAVNSLQPVDEVALNNMHSVTSNAVALAFKGMEVVECGKIDNDKGFYIKYVCGLMEQWNYRTFGNTTLTQIYNLYSAYVSIEFTKPYKAGTVPLSFSAYVPTVYGSRPNVWFGTSNDGTVSNTQIPMEVISYYPYNLNGTPYYVHTVGFWN